MLAQAAELTPSGTPKLAFLSAGLSERAMLKPGLDLIEIIYFSEVKIQEDGLCMHACMHVWTEMGGEGRPTAGAAVQLTAWHRRRHSVAGCVECAWLHALRR